MKKYKLIGLNSETVNDAIAADVFFLNIQEKIDVVFNSLTFPIIVESIGETTISGIDIVKIPNMEPFNEFSLYWFEYENVEI